MVLPPKQGFDALEPRLIRLGIAEMMLDRRLALGPDRDRACMLGAPTRRPCSDPCCRTYRAVSNLLELSKLSWPAESARWRGTRGFLDWVLLDHA